MNNTLLIVGDPRGNHTLAALRKYPAESITVWESPSNHYTLQQLSDKINIVSDLDTLSDMHFDVVIGNPPYSDRSGGVEGGCTQLDSRFVLKCMELADRGSLIIRAKHFMSPKSKFRRELFSSNRLTSIVRCSEDTFPSILNTETCIVSWDLVHTNPCKITYKSGEVREVVLSKDTLVKLTNPDFKDSVDNNLAHRWVRGKLSRKNIIEGSQPMVEILGKGEEPVVVYIQEGQEICGMNTYGVVMNHATQWGALGKVMLKPYAASISGSIILLKTDTEEEAVQLRDYLLTDEVKELVKENMPSFHPNRDLFSKITDPLL